MTSLSVIIPFYKDYAFLDQAINSVLMQGIADAEIIVVNDNPGPETESFFSGLQLPSKVKLVTHEYNRGLSAARNTGVANAQGSYIAYLDADDYYLCDGLKRQFEFAKTTGAEVTVARTATRERLKNGRVLESVLSIDKRIFEQPIEHTTISETPELQFIISSWKSIYRRDHLDRRSIEFDETQRKFEDRLYVLQNVMSGASFASTPDVSRIWRRREGSITTGDRSAADIHMMANLVDKCTLEVEAAVNSGRATPLHLHRETFHSLCRIMHNTQLIKYLVRDDALAGEIRPVIQKAIARRVPEKDILNDALGAMVSRIGAVSDTEIVLTEDLCFSAGQAIAEGNWTRLQGLMRQKQESVVKKSPAVRVAAKPAGNGELSDVKLTVHVGLHKTGTTHLQRELDRQRSTLQANGLLFPKTGFTNSASKAAKRDATPGHQAILAAAMHGNELVRKQLLDEVQSSGCKHVLISCENMSFPYAGENLRNERFEAINDFFRDFSDRAIVMAVRRPDTYLESLYGERVMNATMAETRRLHNFFETQGREILDLKSRIHLFEQFASRPVTAYSYEAFSSGGNYAQKFLDLVQPGIEVAAPSQSRTYPSPSRQVVEAVRLLNALLGASDKNLDLSRALARAGGELNLERASVISPQVRKEIIAFGQENFEEVLRERGLTLPFEKWFQALDDEASSWTALTHLDSRLLHLLVDAGSAFDTAERLENGDAGQDRFFGFSTQSLRSIYQKLPSGGKRLARAAFISAKRLRSRS